MVIMDIDKILVQLAGVAGKRKGDLKRIYNNLIKKKEEEGITRTLLGDNFERIILIGVCNKYEIPIEKLDSYLEETKATEEYVESTEEEEDDDDEDDEVEWEEDEEEDDDEDEIDWEDDDEDDDEGFEEFDDVDHGEDKSWESIFKATPKPKKGDEEGFERLESVQQVDGTKYYFKLADPEEKPYIYEGVGKRDNKDYVSYALDVILVRLSPKRRYENKYKKGDNRGNKMFVKGKKYKLWLSQTAWNWFVEFWTDDLGLSVPDGRIFSYEKVKLEKVTEYYFAEPKKRKK